MSGYTRNVTRTHKLGEKSCPWQLISGSKHKYQWGMCYRCVELLPFLRVISTHTPRCSCSATPALSTPVLSNPVSSCRLVHSRLVHPSFFVLHCPLSRCPFLLFRADLSTPALSTLAISAPPSGTTVPECCKDDYASQWDNLKFDLCMRKWLN